MENKKFNGIIPALLTPFSSDNKVNHKALRALIRFSIEKGVRAFYVGGSTAEVFLLSVNERKEILETVVDEVNGNCGIIAHIGSISQDVAIDLAKHACLNCADAVSSIPPFYYPFSFGEIKSYYFEIVEAVDIPMIVYHFPAFSGVSMNSENIGEFLADERIIGVKFTHNDFFLLNQIKTQFPHKLVWSGYDEMFVSGMAAGADGAIGSTFNFMADKFIFMKKLCDEGEYKKAREIQAEVNRIIKAILTIGILPSEKEILNMMGFEFGRCRKPFKQINEEEREKIKEVLSFNNMVRNR